MNMDPEALGFILVCGAASATAIGSSLVYSERIIDLRSKEILGLSLGLSVGVMLYVSFVEIFQKSVSAFEDSGMAHNMAYFYTTLCFFMGIFSIRLLDLIVHKLEPNMRIFHNHNSTNVEENDNPDKVHFLNERDDAANSRMIFSRDKQNTNIFFSRDAVTPSRDGYDVNRLFSREAAVPSSRDGNDTNRLFSREAVVPIHDDGINIDIISRNSSRDTADSVNTADEENLANKTHDIDNKAVEFYSRAASQDLQEQEEGQEQEQSNTGGNHTDLERMGLFTAIAIALHNFPEGLATFVATLDDPSVGIALAIAIAIHNFPEGLSVAMPIYYATGNKHKAFLWGTFSGMSEVLAGALGWVLLANVVGDVAYGILFGLVAGMMVAICLYDLLPTARNYSKNSHIAHSVVVGMLIMAISLNAFLF